MKKLRNFLSKHKTLRNATIGSLLYFMPITGCDNKPAEQAKTQEFDTQKIEQKISSSYNEFLQNQDSTFQAFADSEKTAFENYVKKDSADFKEFVDSENQKFEDFKQGKPEPETAVVEEPKTVDEVYKVKKGDHLWSIAKQYGKETDKDIVSFIKDVQDYNNLDLKRDVKVVNSEGKLVDGQDGLVDLIYVGNELKIKRAYEPEPEESEEPVTKTPVEPVITDSTVVEPAVSVETDTAYVSQDTSKTEMPSLIDTNEVSTELDSLIQSFDVAEDSTPTETVVDSVKADQDSVSVSTEVDNSYIDLPSDDPLIEAVDAVESELDSLVNVMDKEIAVIDSISAELDSLYESQDSTGVDVQDSTKVDLEKTIEEVEEKTEQTTTEKLSDYIVEEGDHLWKIAKEQGKQETKEDIVSYIKDVQDVNEDLTLDKDVVVVDEEGKLVEGQDGLVDLIYVGDTLNLKIEDPDTTKTDGVDTEVLKKFEDETTDLYNAEIDSLSSLIMGNSKEYNELKQEYGSLKKTESELKEDFDQYNKKWFRNNVTLKKKEKAYLNLKDQVENIKKEAKTLYRENDRLVDERESVKQELEEYRSNKIQEQNSAHTVKKGESLWSIAKQYGRETREEVVDFINEVQSLNNFPESDDVYMINENGDFIKGQDGLTDLIYVGNTLNLTPDLVAGYGK